MSKDRSGAFFDAVFAIIMTILVLELERPEHLTWSAIWSLRTSYFAYAISFFWLGTMWINIHNEWERASKVSIKTIWLELILLFFTSFFPYTTSLVSAEFDNSVAQVLYGIIVLAVTVVFMRMFTSLGKDNQDNEDYQQYVKTRHVMGKWIRYDVVIKLVGLTLSATIFPPAMLLSVVVTLVILVIPRQLAQGKNTG